MTFMAILSLIGFLLGMRMIFFYNKYVVHDYMRLPPLLRNFRNQFLIARAIIVYGSIAILAYSLGLYYGVIALIIRIIVGSYTYRTNYSIALNELREGLLDRERSKAITDGRPFDLTKETEAIDNIARDMINDRVRGQE